MSKLVILKLDGNFERQGFRVTLEIGTEGSRPDLETSAELPPAPEMPSYLRKWQQNYRNIGALYRIKPKKITYDGSVNQHIERCRDSSEELRSHLAKWLNSDQFREVDKRLREELKREEPIRLLIRTQVEELQKIPWHLWDFFERYQHAEYALSSTKFERLKTPTEVTRKGKIRILAILGHQSDINVEEDRKLLENLPNAEVNFLVEPQRQEINDQLWQQPWDILFFAGHSETQDETGRIYINPQDSLTIDELWYALRKAVDAGLKLAIFNSCDGLGLARRLDDLQIPQMIVMRELVPDKVAQEFLKYFLDEFVKGKSLYLAVRQARQRLQGLETEFPCATWLPVIYQNIAEIPPTWEQLQVKAQPSKINKNQQQLQIQKLIEVLLASVVITAFVVGMRSLGILQPLELKAYDWLMRSRPDEGMDRRILLVTITEKDVQAQPAKERGGASLSEKSLNRLLKILQKYQPRAIGLHIFRENPVSADYPDLAKRMRTSDRLIGVCSYGTKDQPGVPPPPEALRSRFGFNNFLTDPDGILRRQLLAIGTALDCPAEYAFSVKLAKRYLADKGIQIQNTPDDYLQLGNTVFKTLEKDTGGYHNLESRGHQIMLNYRATHKIASQLTLAEVLNNQFNPDLIKNRIILIGTTASTFNDDDWLTPYSAKQWQIQTNSGIEIQAHMVSQILSAVLDNRPLIWCLPKAGEAFWIWVWSLLGGILAACCQSSFRLIAAKGIALCLLYGICLISLLQGGWIPLVPSGLALVVAGGSFWFYKLSQQSGSR